MKCRRFNVKDALIIEDAVEQLEISYLPDKIDAFLKNERNYFFVVSEDNTVVGYAYAYALETFNGKNPMLFIFSVDILPQYQEKGYGSNLLSFIVNYAKSNGFSECFVITERSNPSACRVYEKAGFVAEHNDDVVYVAEFD